MINVLKFLSSSKCISVLHLMVFQPLHRFIETGILDMPIQSHPIFKTVSTGTNHAKRFFLSTEDSSKVLVIQGNSLKWTSLGQEDYEYAEFDAIEDYDHATLNNTGSLLCIYNDHCLQVVALTWNSIRPVVYNITPDVSIRQIVWHPRGVLDSTLVVLGENGELLVFELLSEDFTKPTLVLNSPSKQLGYSSNLMDITSICFSADGLTLYTLNTSDGGDLFSIYPFLPSKFSISPDSLNLIFHKALLQYETLGLNDDSSVKRNVIKQLQFVSRLHKQFTDEQVLPANGQLTFELSANYYEAGFQGPYTINPFPEKLYSVTAKQIQVLKFSGSASELLLISFDDGTILKCFPDLEPCMSWEKQEYSYNNSLILVDSMMAKGNLVSISYDKIVALGPEKATLVECDRIMNTLKRSLEEFDLSDLVSADITDVVTDFKGCFDSVGTWKFEGHLNLIMLSATEIKNTVLSRTPEKVLTNSKPTAESKVKYEVHFSQPSNELDALHKKVQSACKSPLKTVIPPQQRLSQLKNESNEEQLSTLTKISREIMNRIMVSQTFGLTLHNRLKEQQAELTRQLSASSKILRNEEKISVLYDTQKSKWEKALNREQNIDNRLELLQQKLSQVAQSKQLQALPLSKAEIEWFLELRSQVSLFNKSVLEQQNVRESLDLLKADLDTLAQSCVLDNEKEAFSWKELQKVLEEDSEIIKKCNKELKTTADELEKKI